MPMIKLSTSLICFLVCLYASSAGAQAHSPQSDLATADWSVKRTHGLNTQPKEFVWKFINRLWGSDDLNAGSGKVCEFKFVSLRHSGQLSLVVSYDNGGLADCNMVNIFDKTTAGVKDYDFNASVPVHLNSVQDINKDGNFEVILDEVFATGGMHQCTATWPVIHAWNGTGYANVSAEFKGYYRRTLIELQHHITIPTSPTPEPLQKGEKPSNSYLSSGTSEEPFQPQPTADDSDSRIPSVTPSTDSDTDCQKVEISKIERFLGISREAGLDDAIKWADSDNPDDREFAASILSDIGTTEAIGYLRTLSNDPNTRIAQIGKEFLSEKVPNTSPVVRGELIPINTDPTH